MLEQSKFYFVVVPARLRYTFEGWAEKFGFGYVAKILEDRVYLVKIGTLSKPVSEIGCLRIVPAPELGAHAFMFGDYTTICERDYMEFATAFEAVVKGMPPRCIVREADTDRIVSGSTAAMKKFQATFSNVGMAMPTPRKRGAEAVAQARAKRAATQFDEATIKETVDSMVEKQMRRLNGQSLPSDFDPDLDPAKLAFGPDGFGLKFSGTKDAYASGATRDAAAGKGRYDLISTHALRRLAVVYEKGAVNHGDRNWEHGLPRSRTLSSAMRHLQQAIEGQTDEDHLGQAAWNIFAAIHFEALGRKDLDDTRLEPIAAARNPATDSVSAMPAA